MEFGLFVVPYRAPTTDITQGLAWDLKCIGWAEEYGLHEVWIAEHFTLGWENVCAPELLIAAAAQFTRRIRLVNCAAAAMRSSGAQTFSQPRVKCSAIHTSCKPYSSAQPIHLRSQARPCVMSVVGA